MQQALCCRAASALDDRMGFYDVTLRDADTNDGRLTEVFKIKQDRTGFAVTRQKIQQFIHVDIQAVTRAMK